MNYVPAWILCIPERDDPNYLDYLINQAYKDGVPKHVIANLIKKYHEKETNENSDKV